MSANWLIAPPEPEYLEIPVFESELMYTDDELLVIADALESESDIALRYFDAAMEGAGADAFRTLQTGMKEIRKNKSAIKKLAKAGNYTEAANLCRKTMSDLDGIERSIRNLPPDSKSAVFIGLMIALATILAALGGMALGSKVMSINVGKKTLGGHVDTALVKAKYHVNDTAAKSREIAGKEWRKVNTPAMTEIGKTQKKEIFQIRSNRNLDRDAKKSLISGARAKADLAYKEQAAKYDGFIKKGINKANREASAEMWKNTKGTGEFLGQAVGAGITSTALGKFLKSKGLYITGEKRKDRPSGEKKKLSPNDYNALIAACLKSIKDTRAKLEKLAKKLEKQASKGAAIESIFAEGHFECAAALEGFVDFLNEETFDNAMEAAVEGFYDGLAETMDDSVAYAAMEGTNIDAIRIFNAKKKEIRALRSEIRDAEKKKDYHTAATKARECADKWGELESTINDLPDSMGSKTLIDILYTTLSLLALAVVAGGAMVALKKTGADKSIKEGIRKAADLGETAGKAGGAAKHQVKTILKDPKSARGKAVGHGVGHVAGVGLTSGGKSADIAAKGIGFKAPGKNKLSKAVNDTVTDMTDVFGKKGLTGKIKNDKVRGIANKIATAVPEGVGKFAGNHIKGEAHVAARGAAAMKLGKSTELPGVATIRNAVLHTTKKAAEKGGKTGRTVAGLAAAAATVGSSAMASLKLGKTMISAGIMDTKGALTGKNKELTANDKNRLLQSLKQACKDGKAKYLAAAQRYDSLAKSFQAAAESMLGLGDVNDFTPDENAYWLGVMESCLDTGIEALNEPSVQEAWLASDSSRTMNSWLL